MISVNYCVAPLGHLQVTSPTETYFLSVFVRRWKESHKLERVTIGFGVGLYTSSRDEPLITSPPLPPVTHDPNIPPDLLLGGTVASCLTTQANLLPLHSSPDSPCRSPLPPEVSPKTSSLPYFVEKTPTVVNYYSSTSQQTTINSSFHYILQPSAAHQIKLSPTTYSPPPYLLYSNFFHHLPPHRNGPHRLISHSP